MSEQVDTSNVVSLVSKQMDLDFDYIQRNVRDLAATAQFQPMSDKELTELYRLAYSNLKEQMGVGKPLAVDPGLVMEAYRLISGTTINFIESKRKSTETLMKARTLFSTPPLRGNTNGLIDEGNDIFDEDVSEASVTNETGLFGGIIKDADQDPEL